MKNLPKLIKNKEFRRGVVFAAGLFLVLDNIVFHWILKLHHAIGGPHAYQADLAAFIVGLTLLAYSLLKR